MRPRRHRGRARTARDAHAIYFLVDAAGEKNGQIERFPAVSVAWADNGNFKYAVISGQAKLTNDRAKIAELFTKSDEAWWEDANDPAIRLLTLTPEKGELWDSPGKAVALVKMAVAAVTGAAPQMGDNAKVGM